ncbi:phosphate ABC transporter substrate-binding protein PstS family protein [Planctomicrobium sp. SH527]|uniref:PstS family phosphate ABC transporter substrate-binding protein n=1 Tax=Planctomicrobium sp. SH527 TaxID=3448123 RepID=UPI003F5BA9DD
MRSTSALLLGILCATMVGCPSGNQSSPSGKAESKAVSTKGFMPPNAVAVSVETIRSGEYKPLSRPLLLYVNKAALKKPETIEFLRYYFTDEGNLLIEECGFVPITTELFHKQLEILEAEIKAVGGESKDGPLNGQLLIDGSSTVAPVTTVIAEEFSRKHPAVRVPVGTSGTGGGFKKFCAGEISICNASRHIKESEIELCKKNGIEYLELEICLDGLTIVVNPKNDWIAGITVEELKKLWSPGSEIKKWSEINPEYPDVEIKLFGPDTDSGTFEYFTEAICGKKGASRSDYQQSGDDNFLVTGVAGDEYALAYFGYSYYVENQGKLKALSVAP